MRTKKYRHTPAFILMFLAKEKNYGQALLKSLNTEMPSYKTDSAMVYRTLQELEDGGFVKSFWQEEKVGNPKKWYEITSLGKEKLSEYKMDIENRMKNFEYFLAQYDGLDLDK